MTPEFTVRPATEADAQAIASAEGEVFADAWSLSSVRDTLASPISTSHIAVDQNGGIAGYCLSTCIPPEGEILRIAVLPSCRRMGLGKVLIGRTPGETVFLEVRAKNSPAIALYRACGFAETGRRKNYYQNPADDAVLMQKERREP